MFKNFLVALVLLLLVATASILTPSDPDNLTHKDAVSIKETKTSEVTTIKF